jgi:hypothetical protein
MTLFQTDVLKCVFGFHKLTFVKDEPFGDIQLGGYIFLPSRKKIYKCDVCGAIKEECFDYKGKRLS